MDKRRREMEKVEVDLTNPEHIAIYRRAYKERYAETVGEKETVRKDKAHWHAFIETRKAVQR